MVWNELVDASCCVHAVCLKLLGAIHSKVTFYDRYLVEMNTGLGDYPNNQVPNAHTLNCIPYMPYEYCT